MPWKHAEGMSLRFCVIIFAIIAVQYAGLLQRDAGFYDGEDFGGAVDDGVGAVFGQLLHWTESPRHAH